MSITIDVQSALRGIVIAIFVGVAVGIVVLLFKRVRSFFAGRAFDAEDRNKMQQRWREIEQMLGTTGEMARKVAVLEADKLLDLALKTLAMPGTTLGERLKFASYKYPELRNVWWAHKVRNQLAHEASYHLDAGMAKKAVAEFRSALERLGAI